MVASDRPGAGQGRGARTLQSRGKHSIPILGDLLGSFG